MSLIPLGVVWLGYQLLWYGYSMVRGPGMGFTDLMLPTRIAKVDKTIGGWSASKPNPSAPAAAPSFVNSVGVQTGSIYNPTLPGGGRNQNPALGATPPAGYS